MYACQLRREGASKSLALLAWPCSRCLADHTSSLVSTHVHDRSLIVRIDDDVLTVAGPINLYTCIQRADRCFMDGLVDRGVFPATLYCVVVVFSDPSTCSSSTSVDHTIL